MENYVHRSTVLLTEHQYLSQSWVFCSAGNTLASLGLPVLSQHLNGSNCSKPRRQGAGEYALAWWRKRREQVFAENSRCARYRDVSSEFRGQKTCTQVAIWALWPWANHWISSEPLFSIKCEYDGLITTMVAIPLPPLYLCPFQQDVQVLLWEVELLPMLWTALLCDWLWLTHKQCSDWRPAGLCSLLWGWSVCSLLCLSLPGNKPGLACWEKSRLGGENWGFPADSLPAPPPPAHCPATHNCPEV